jgi:EmrB/QacA subfamily drug resistance transporter
MDNINSRPIDKKAERWVLALASIASFMVVLDTLVVSVALSTIRQELYATLEELEWTVNIYSLCFATLLITATSVGDRFGRKRVFIFGILLFVAASIVCALSTSIKELIIARAVQGVGGAFVLPLAMALLADAIPPERRSKALGIFSGITGLGILGGPVLGGAITEGVAWQWIFWINVPIGLLLIPFVTQKIRESWGHDATFDIAGLLYAILASFGLMWGLMRGNQAGWFSTEIISAFMIGIAFTVVFIWWENKTSTPMIPMRFFKSSSFALGNLATFLLSSTTFSSVFFIAQFLQIEQGFAPLEAGLRVLPWTATLFIIAPISGRLVHKLGERALISGGLLLQTLALVWLANIASPGIAYTKMVVPFLLSGTGLSLAIPATQSCVLNSVQKHQLGKASGVFNMLRQMGAVFGIAILVLAFSANGGYKSAQDFNNGFVMALYAGSMLSFLGAISGYCLPKMKLQNLGRNKN